MIEAYCRLHRSGFAHSVEAWRDGRLAGGLYGISLGRCFFGESMFSAVPNASKAALAGLVAHLRAAGGGLIDCQVTTGHLQRMGAREIPRKRYLMELAQALEADTLVGCWQYSTQAMAALMPARRAGAARLRRGQTPAAGRKKAGKES
jgi:leucyl/phenylalanyl-tRNA--protein transferase